jgi:hypothetical protein
MTRGERKAAEAKPVGSNTVPGPSASLPAQGAEAVVIAWLRHRTTGFGGMVIARIRGKRREVRRLLAGRSKESLGRYRRGEPVGAECPLRRAL